MFYLSVVLNLNNIKVRDTIKLPRVVRAARAVSMNPSNAGHSVLLMRLLSVGYETDAAVISVIPRDAIYMVASVS